MAVVKLGYSSTESYLAYNDESAFGTPIADSAATWTKLKTVANDVPGFSPAQYIDKTMTHQDTNIADIGDYYMTRSGIWQRYALPEIYPTTEDLSHLLYAVSQSGTEVGTTPYLKTFTFDGTTSLANDFSANAGYFFSFVIKSPVSSNSVKLESCILESLTLKIGRENGGRIIASGTVLSGRNYVTNSDPEGGGGTFAYSAATVPNYYDATASTLSLNTVDLSWDSIEFTITNTVDWIGNASGEADNYKIMKQTLTGNVVCKYDTNSDTFRDQVGTDKNTTTLTINAAGADPYFYFTCPNTWVDSAQKVTDGDSVQKLNLGLDFVADISAAEYPSFKIEDVIQHGFPAPS